MNLGEKTDLRRNFLDESCRIYEAKTGNGKTRLFKTLYTNECAHHCRYCPNSHLRGSCSYTPGEFARTFHRLHSQNRVEGLFLSSGIGKDEDRVMDNMLSSVSILRNDFDYEGYIHLKILPGASRDHVKRAVELSDRVSINVEAPSRVMLSELSPTKDFSADIIRRKRYIRDEIRKSGSDTDSTTQFLVGALSEPDERILDYAFQLYEKFDLSRVYYSIFKPRKHTEFSDRKPVPGWRGARLYQMDFLYRGYPYEKDELKKAFDEEGFLKNRDPKELIAEKSLLSPIDPNIASYELLLKVPGIGPKSAGRIERIRKNGKIETWNQLRGIGIQKRAAYFLDIQGTSQSFLHYWT